ncbi:MAG: PH domain-containing protein [Balneolales bacterium]
MNQQKNITLHPDWKDQFVRYLIGAALVPVFGIGLLIISSARNRLKETSYVISDNEITLNEQDESTSINLANIKKVRANQSSLGKRFNIGRIQLEGNEQNYELRGIENPKRIEKILLIAVETEKDRVRQKAKVKGDFPELNAGSVDKVNTLVGLWQQGLINDEEYDRERKRI